MTEKKVETVEAEIVTDAISTDVQSTALTPMNLIERAMAVDGGVDIEKMTQLFELNLKYEENEAKKAYYAAIAAFKGETIEILKDKSVGYENRDGTFTGYKHASLGKVVEIVTPYLAKHGLGHSWDIDQSGEDVKVTCVLTHKTGFSTSVSMSAVKDDSGKKNKIQMVSSTVTYLQRYTFLAATGLAAKEQDDDGAGSEQPEVEVITEDQWANLDTMISQAGGDNQEKNLKTFCTVYKIKSLAHLPVDKYTAVVKKLQGQIKNKEEAK